MIRHLQGLLAGLAFASVAAVMPASPAHIDASAPVMNANAVQGEMKNPRSPATTMMNITSCELPVNSQVVLFAWDRSIAPLQLASS